MILVTMKDVRSCRMCSYGVRNFFRRHNLDWSKFLSEGLPEDVVLATGDAMAREVVEAARGRQG